MGQVGWRERSTGDEKGYKRDRIAGVRRKEVNRAGEERGNKKGYSTSISH